MRLHPAIIAFVGMIVCATTFLACCPCDYATKDIEVGEGVDVRIKQDGKDGVEMGLKRPIRLNYLEFEAGTRYVKQQYDADGNKQDLFGSGDASERLTYVKLSYTRQLIGGIDFLDSKFSLKGRTWIDYASLSETIPYNINMTMDRSGSGFRSTGLEASFGTRRLLQTRLGGRIFTGYQLNLEGDPDPSDPDKQQYSSRQNAFYIGTEWDYWCKKMRLEFDAYYDITTEREDNGFTYDLGDILAISAGGSYGFKVSETITLAPALNLNFLSKSETKSNGNSQANSDGYILSLTPAVNIRLATSGLSFKVAYGYEEEFQRTPVGGIALSGKNLPVPGGFTGSIGAQYRF